MTADLKVQVVLKGYYAHFYSLFLIFLFYLITTTMVDILYFCCLSTILFIYLFFIQRFRITKAYSLFLIFLFYLITTTMVDILYFCVCLQFFLFTFFIQRFRITKAYSLFLIFLFYLITTTMVEILHFLFLCLSTILFIYLFFIQWFRITKAWVASLVPRKRHLVGAKKCKAFFNIVVPSHLFNSRNFLFQPSKPLRIFFFNPL